MYKEDTLFLLHGSYSQMEKDNHAYTVTQIKITLKKQ